MESPSGRLSVPENPFEAILEHEHPWSVKDIGSNSISSIVVEQSILSAASFLAAAKSIKVENAPVIPPTPIRRIRLAEFDPYFGSIAEVMDKYQLHKAQGSTALEGIPDLESDDIEKELELELQSLLPMKHNKSMDRLNRSRMFSSIPREFKDIPAYFKDPNFDIRNPHTFNLIVNNTDMTKMNSGEEELFHRTLIDKLLLYRDAVEVKLLHEVSHRSAQFLEALTNLQQLERTVIESLENVQAMRAHLSELSEQKVKSGLLMIREHQRECHLNVMNTVNGMIKHAKEAKPVIETLLHQSDYVGALDLIEETSAVLYSVHGSKNTARIEEITPGIKFIDDDAAIPSYVNLKEDSSVVQLSEELHTLSRDIQKKLQEEFIAAVIRDLKIHMEGIVSTPGIQHLQGTAFTSIKNILAEHYGFTSTPSTIDIPPADIALTQTDEALKGVLLPLVVGLLRMDRLEEVLHAYRELLVTEMKNGSRQYYPRLPDTLKNPALSKEDQKKLNDTEFAKQLRSMSFDSFYATLTKLFVYYLRALQRAAVVNDIIQRIVKDSEQSGLLVGKSKLPELPKHESPQPNIKLKEEEDDVGNLDQINLPEGRQSEIARPSVAKETTTTSFGQIINESKNVLHFATDFTHTRCAKLLVVRSEQNSQLNPKDFYRLFHASWEFLIAGEQLCGKMCFGLKGSLLSQAKSFINYFHEEKSKQIALLLENEQWLQADIPVDFLHLTEQLQSNASNQAVTLKKNVSKESINGADEEEIDLTMAPKTVNSSSESVATPENSTSSKYMLIDGSKYHAVVSTLMFLKMLSEYVQCAKNIPSLAPEVLNRIYELLKLFNSRTCQLILGSGAMRSAGLERITAKHIALASQSLGLVMAVIPYIKTGISNLLNLKQHVLLVDFDRIIGDYRDHQNELYMNLINIMVSRLAEHATNLVSINWDSPDKKDFCSDGISVPMSVLVTETQTLHKVASKYLPPEALRVSLAKSVDP
jgi:vacuolar protein sorting-associated protein 54